jgi:hypothetical protein
MKVKIGIWAKGRIDLVAAAARIELETEATECKRRCPVLTGNLRSTIHVEGPEREGNHLSISIVAGGPAAPYAVAVHEDLEAFHPNGEAKFIEGPLRESGPYLPERIARRARSL